MTKLRNITGTFARRSDFWHREHDLGILLQHAGRMVVKVPMHLSKLPDTAVELTPRTTTALERE